MKMLRELRPIFVIAAAVIVLEVLLFNFRHWQSVNNTQVIAAYTASDNLSAEDVNVFRVTGSDTSPYLEVSGLDLDVENIAVDFTFPEMGVTAAEVIQYHLEVIDDGNSFPYSLPQMEFMHLVPQSHYDYLDLYGKAKTIRLCFDNLYEGTLIRVEYFNINSVVPLMISKKRMLALFLFLSILYCLRPGSCLYEMDFEDRKRTGIICVAALVLAESLFAFWLVNVNEAFKDPSTPGERQFMLLAESLAQGKPYLMMEPPQELKDMEDPYDYAKRLMIFGDDDIRVPWDTAYYKGHYYVYFGVGPILCYYLPYYLVTGDHIRTVSVVLINAILAFISIALLLRELIKRLLGEISLPVYLMITFLATFGCGVIFLLMKPDIYAVPLSMALPLCFFGLYLWISSLREEGISIWRIGLGSLMLAFEAAVRPQFLLASFLALLIFYTAAVRKRQLFSRKSISATIAFIIPYCLVAAFVMYYNYIRFGSVFDFGANYNLTGTNLPYRGFRLDRLLNGTVGFLFSPYSVRNAFPYIDMTLYNTTYQGPSVDENLLGGLIYNNKYLIFTLLPFLFRKYVDRKEEYIYIVAAPFAALIVMIVDSNMSGVITRYYCDFAFYLLISFTVILCGLLKKSGERVKNMMYWILTICFASTLFKIFLFTFTGEGRPKDNFKLVWHTAKHLTEFWH